MAGVTRLGWEIQAPPSSLATAPLAAHLLGPYLAQRSSNLGYEISVCKSEPLGSARGRLGGCGCLLHSKPGPRAPPEQLAQAREPLPTRSHGPRPHRARICLLHRTCKGLNSVQRASGTSTSLFCWQRSSCSSPPQQTLAEPIQCQPVLGAGLQDEQKELFVTAGCWAVFQVMGCNSEHSQEGHALHGTYLPSRGTQAKHLSCDTRSGCTRRQKENKGQETSVPQEWSVKAFLRKCDLNQTTRLPWGRCKGPVAAQSFAGLKNIKRLKQGGLASKQQRRRLEGRSR